MLERDAHRSLGCRRLHCVLLACVLLVACKRQVDTGAARKALASTDPVERKKGADALKEVYAKDPSALGDPGEKYWVDRLGGLDGAPGAKAREILGGTTTLGSEGSGGGASTYVRLDDYWTARVHWDTDAGKVMSHDPPEREVVCVNVARPDKFTGTWSTYYVDGAVCSEDELEGGRMKRSRDLHDNGKIRREIVYVDGLRDGTVITRFANGTTESEDTYAKGKRVGVQRWFYPNGKAREEHHWADDKRDGRVTYFDKDGKRTRCITYRAGVETGRGCGD